MENRGPRDRLSALPNSLIFEIFWFMPMRDVVITSILSSRWKNLWTTAPYLNFEDFKMVTPTNRVRNFINRALMLWSGTRIQKFKIDFGNYLTRSLYADIDLWVRFAKKNEVEELYVQLDNSVGIIQNGVDPMEVLYSAPQCLYSCSSLKRFYLKGCNLHIPMDNVNWNQLEVLKMEFCYWICEDVISKVLLGSPQLKVSYLHFIENHDNLSIQSTSLTHLTIFKDLYFRGYEPSIDTELKIWTPNLEMLDVSGVPYGKRLIIDLPSLIHAEFWFYGQDYYSHHLFPANDFVGEWLRQLLPTIQQVKQLTLSDSCVKGLGAMNNKCMVLPFPNVEVLQLECFLGEYEEVLHLLEIFQKLERLVLIHDKGRKQFQHRETVEPNLPNSFLQHLRTIKVDWDEDDDSIFPFIEILLKYASKLEKIVFQVEETTRVRQPSNLALKKLLRMPRSSPTAELIFSEY